MFIIVLDGNGSDPRHWLASAMADTLQQIESITQHNGGVLSISKHHTDTRIGATSLTHVKTGAVQDGHIYHVR